jgi:tetratricopeptide (TPR) repeat protein
VPDGFAQATAFASSATDAATLAAEFAQQLNITVGGFEDATQALERETPAERWLALDAFERLVSGPLARLPGAPVRLVLDGLDQLDTAASDAILAMLNSINEEPVLVHVRTVITSRPDTPLPRQADELRIGALTRTELSGYLERRNIPAGITDAFVERARGSWLVTRILADLAVADEFDAFNLPTSLADLYEQALLRATSGRTSRKDIEAVLGALAAGGVGPVLPLALLCAASESLGGPGRPPGVRDVLVVLRGFVVRGQPGTDREEVGLFHSTFAEYILKGDGGAFSLEPRAAHQALVDAIGRLAPIDEHTWEEPLHRYAARAEAEHLWATGAYEHAIQALRLRAAPTPRENLSRWLSLHERAQRSRGAEERHALAIRAHIAFSMGETGEAREALRLFRELLPDTERVLGADHPDTLRTRGNIARWTGQTGEGRNALRLFRELLPDLERVLGADHPDTLRTRHNIALWTGQTGEERDALRLLRELLPQLERELGADHPDTLTTRHNIASWTGQTAEEREALRLFRELLPNTERVLGADHPDTLTTRGNIAAWTGQAGDARGALALFQALLPDLERVLGAEHPDTLTTRNNIAHLTSILQ